MVPNVHAVDGLSRQPRRRRHSRFCGILLLLGSLPLSGCGPSVRSDELGHIIYDASELPGADDPRPRVELQQTPNNGKVEEPQPNSPRNKTPTVNNDGR